MKKRLIICVIITLCVSLWLCVLPAAAYTETSGTCGNNVTWSFDADTQTMTVSGTGPMDGSLLKYGMPWEHLREQIHYVVIQEGITSVCDYAFKNCYNLKEVTIPKSVTSIGRSAFENTDLTQIDLHDGVTHFGINAFESSRLEEFTMPAGAAEVSAGMFRGCKELKKVVLHDGVTVIRSDAFSGCIALQSFVIPDSVEILESAFSSCTGLTDITLSNNLKQISIACFQGCSSLQEIIIPDSVTKIYHWAFQNCYALERVVVGAGIERISYDSFLGCKNLKYFSVSENNNALMNDDNGVIYSKDGLKLVLIPTGYAGEFAVADGTQVIGGQAGYRCEGLTGVTIPDSVTEIGHEAFSDCPGIKSVQLGNGLQYIRDSAFSGCNNLEEIVIPASVVEIGACAFSLCQGMRTIEFQGKCPSFVIFTFSSVSANAYYPAEDPSWDIDLSAISDSLRWMPKCSGPHSFVEAEEVAPSCVSDGQTEYTYCEMCGFISVHPTKLPAKGHSFGAWHYVTPAGTPEREHKVARICEVCDHKQTEYAFNVDASVLPELPVETLPVDTPTDAPQKTNTLHIVIIIIIVVATCFVGVEVYLHRKRRQK